VRKPALCLAKPSRPQTLTENREDFIRANTRLSPVPLLPDIELYLADVGTELRRKTELEVDTGYGPPPFWAFAWAGGQALARYVVDHPEVVAGKHVLDFASGSGLVAIAAAQVGARQVDANDIDPYAEVAMALNAAQNRVNVGIRVDDLIGSHEPWDVILAGDVYYEPKMSKRLVSWLTARAKAGTLVLIGDPERAHFERENLRALASYDVPVVMFLEETAIKPTTIWSFI